MNILLIGAGKWGKNYISTLSSFNNVQLTVANKDNWEYLIEQKPDGIIIATQPEYHISIAQYAISYNIPIMIEKPLALSTKEILSLDKKAIILVNYIHLFSEAYQWIAKSIDTSTITKIISYGYNNGPIRNYSSLWDYGSHDLSMILYLLQKTPDMININIVPETNTIYNIEMNFENIKSISTIGNGAIESRRFLNIEFNGMSISYDDKQRPIVHNSPLKNAVSEFLNIINGKTSDKCGLELSLQITHILEQCDKKLCNIYT